MKKCVRVAVIAVLCAAVPHVSWASGQAAYVETTPRAGNFPLVQPGVAARLVVRASRDLQADINRVTGMTPALGLVWAATAWTASRIVT